MRWLFFLPFDCEGADARVVVEAMRPTAKAVMTWICFALKRDYPISFMTLHGDDIAEFPSESSLAAPVDGFRISQWGGNFKQISPADGCVGAMISICIEDGAVLPGMAFGLRAEELSDPAGSPELSAATADPEGFTGGCCRCHDASLSRWVGKGLTVSLN